MNLHCRNVSYEIKTLYGCCDKMKKIETLSSIKRTAMILTSDTYLWDRGYHLAWAGCRGPHPRLTACPSDRPIRPFPLWRNWLLLQPSIYLSPPAGRRQGMQTFTLISTFRLNVAGCDVYKLQVKPSLGIEFVLDCSVTIVNNCELSLKDLPISIYLSKHRLSLPELKPWKLAEFSEIS